MNFGMPTLIELEGIKDNVRLANELNLDFIEINLNLPEYQPYNIDISYYDSLQKSNDIFYTLHLPEDFDASIFNDDIRESHMKVLKQSIKIARKLKIPIINFHMNLGIYFTLPNQKIFLYEKYNAEYISRLKDMIEFVDSQIGESNIKLCIENTGIHDISFIRRATELLLENDKFMLTWDVGHDFSSGDKDTDFINDNFEKLHHMHLHDAIGERNHLPLFTGDIDINQMLRIAENNDVSVVIETKTIEGLTSSVKMMRKR